MKSIVFTLIVVAATCMNSAFADGRRPLTAHQAAGPLENLELGNLPRWDESSFKQRFREIRDKKFLKFDGEDRRIPWLYARDGCHVRSTHFIREAERLGYEKPMKVFVFGDLQMRGNIIPTGSVEPWFHTAPIVQVAGEPMVLDPSVSFSRPLTLEKWASLIVRDPSKVVYSLCAPETYMQTSGCYEPEPLDEKRLKEETQVFLKFERNILKYIGLGFLKEESN